MWASDGFGCDAQVTILPRGDEKIRRMEVLDPEAPLPEQRWAYREVSGESRSRAGSAPGTATPAGVRP